MRLLSGHPDPDSDLDAASPPAPVSQDGWR